MRWLIILLMLSVPVMADQYISNSQAWQDSYSVMLYARLTGNEGMYVINEGHGLMLAGTLQDEETVVFESVNAPHIRGYSANLQAEGIGSSVRFVEENLNLELAQEEDWPGFIIVDDRYSYNAVSVVAYAARKGYYVIFANADNIDSVMPIVDGSDIILYGYVDREVSDRLAGQQVTLINEGDKFSNNLEMLKLYTGEFSASQLIVTNGAIIEPQFFSGSSPVLFIGQSNVPDQTISYLASSDIKHAVLIGYDVFNNAVTLKNRAGMKVIVKFAKGIDSQQYALDIIQLPQPKLNIGISSVVYNTYNSRLEVTYFNTEPTPAFIKSSHNILVDNSSVAVVGDQEELFIGGREILAVAYNVDLATYDNMVARSNLLYGEDRGALEYLDIVQTTIETTSYEDSSQVEISKVVYDRPTRRFHVTVENTGSIDVYVKPLLIDVIVNNRPETLTADAEQIPKGGELVFKIKARLTPEDIEDNEEILAGARYGRRETALINYIERSFEFSMRYLSTLTWIAVGAGIAVLIMVLIVLVPRLSGQNNRLGPAPPPR
jgi:hypothetical protein